MADPAALAAELPNPFTPMAFLPPELAFQITITFYIAVGSLSVLIWDILINMQNDYRLVTQHRVGIPTVVYFVSRWSCLAHLFAIVIVDTAPITNCAPVRWLQCLYIISIPSTCLLFFFRIKALFHDNKWVVAFFSLTWLGVLGGCLTPILGIRGINIAITKYCTISQAANFISAAAIAPLVNDTLIFLATTYALMQNSYAKDAEQITTKVKVALFGHKLPALSKALLQDGQVYYLTTITLNLVTSILFFNTKIPTVYRSCIGIPNIVLMNSMACLVFRNIKFGLFRETSTLGTMPSSLSVATAAGRAQGARDSVTNGPIVFIDSDQTKGSEKSQTTATTTDGLFELDKQRNSTETESQRGDDGIV